MSSALSRPVIIVTGANGGVGFGVCERLLLQALSNDPIPHYSFHVQPKITEQVSFEGMTLILACRSRQRAEAARDKLYQLVDEQVCRLEMLPGYNGHANTFRKHLFIAIHTIELSSIQTVFQFADQVTKTYPYISHLICNAGVASFLSLNFLKAIKDICENPLEALLTPKFYTQGVGKLSQDGLGWVWQCNVFGHYVLFRVLKHHLAKYKSSTGARVIWVSSHEATSTFYSPDDWQLVKSAHSYESSKFQLELIAHHLDRSSLEQESEGLPIRHQTVLPGVAGTNIARALLGTFTAMCMLLSFYIVRLLGSPYHLISGFKASISAVHLCLVPLAYLPTVDSVKSDDSDPLVPVEVGIRYVSECDRWGRERVGTMKLTRSKEQEKQIDALIKNCERLLHAFCEAEGRPVPS